jgi:hypothetical protein
LIILIFITTGFLIHDLVKDKILEDLVPHGFVLKITIELVFIVVSECDTFCPLPLDSLQNPAILVPLHVLVIVLADDLAGYLLCEGRISQVVFKLVLDEPQHNIFLK